jgi:hypothetical protein
LSSGSVESPVSDLVYRATQRDVRGFDLPKQLGLPKIAMPRGSKPGERRGGRQRGTPNKKTALRNAALAAAAANPEISPLEFLLGIMRDPNVSSELRIKVAQTTLPFMTIENAWATKSFAVRRGLGQHQLAREHRHRGRRLGYVAVFLHS